MEWLKETTAQVGGSIHLYLPEQGLDGPATVQAIGPCPPIRSGTGEVVTATITHIRSGVLELKLAGIDGPLGVTDNHPVYSVDRRAFIPAADLQPGETLQLLGGVTQIESIHPLPGHHRVYNLEVHARHVYHVTSAGVLVHNASPHIVGTEFPWTTGATPNSKYTYIDPNDKAIQTAIYDANGDALGRVDFKKHGTHTSGHGHKYPIPGDPQSGAGTHIPYEELDPVWTELPPTIEPNTPIGQ